MSGSAIVAVTAWSALVGFVSYGLARDFAAWRRAQRRGRVRRVPPRPAQTRFQVARTVDELDALFESSAGWPEKLA